MRRNNAVKYALEHDDDTSDHDGYHYYEGGDCTNFVSQCLADGGIPQDIEAYPGSVGWYWGNYSKWFFGKEITNASATWVNPDPFYRYFSQSNRCTGVSYVSDGDNLSTITASVRPGDVIAFNNFDEVSKGKINHVAIVTSIQDDGIHFSGHTNTRTDEPLQKVMNDSNYHGDIYIIHIKY